MDLTALAHLPSLADLAHTRRVSLYRLRAGDDLHSLRAPKVVHDDHEFVSLNAVVGGMPALLVAGLSDDDPVEWGAMVRSLTGTDLDFRSRTASAALFVRSTSDSGDEVYAVTFGQGWRLIRDSSVDRISGCGSRCACSIPTRSGRSPGGR
ncbi:hypothetical protein ALI144C_22910 [Actinosynnema sp. ALI-1.44]|nr:DUF6119 family protein [Actinosynnema sp. ALI-1.44]ONI79632.1 hypothetical protein ALI144C_22910 [Actinosynnema sp. ALI-1.44]